MFVCVFMCVWGRPNTESRKREREKSNTHTGALALRPTCPGPKKRFRRFAFEGWFPTRLTPAKATVLRCFPLPLVPFRLAAGGRGQKKTKQTLSGEERNVTFLNHFDLEWNSCIMLLRNRLIRAIWVAETLRRPFFIFYPPGLASSSRP